MLFVNNLDQNGSHEQRSRFLPSCCDGTLIAGMCMSEPGAGKSSYHITRGNVALLKGRPFFQAKSLITM